MEQIAITAQHINDIHLPLQYCVFDENGGTIGSDNTNSFCLQDDTINDRHINIQYEEGCFTIASINDSEVFYNNSFSKLHSGYETTIELGDTFRAGNYKFGIIDTKDIKEDFIDNKKVINEVTPYNKLDSLEIKPRGQISGLNLNEENIENILTENNSINDLLHVAPLQESLSILKANQQNIQINDSINSHHNIGKETKDTHKDICVDKNMDTYIKTSNQQDNNITQKIANSTLQYIKVFLSNTLDTHKTTKLHLDDIITQTKSVSLEHETLQSILNNTFLINSTPIINSIILALITKELYNPLYDILDDNPFILTLDYALYQTMQGNNKALETLLLKALENYINNKI